MAVFIDTCPKLKICLGLNLSLTPRSSRSLGKYWSPQEIPVLCMDCRISLNTFTLYLILFENKNSRSGHHMIYGGKKNQKKTNTETETPIIIRYREQDQFKSRLVSTTKNSVISLIKLIFFNGFL